MLVLFYTQKLFFTAPFDN